MYKILIVEDDETIRNGIKTLLELPLNEKLKLD